MVTEWQFKPPMIVRMTALVVMVLVCLALNPAWGAQDQDPPPAPVQQLEAMKLEREIARLEQEIALNSGGWRRFVQSAPFITAIIALLGVFVTVWRQMTESSRQREVDRRQLESEQVRRFDERFHEIIEGLGSEGATIRAGAAVSILSYLNPEHARFHEQVFLVLLANLKLPHDNITRSLLVRGFEQAIRQKAIAVEALNAEIEEKDEKIILDLSHCDLPGAHLAALNLSWADIRESNLRSAHFRRACLQRLNAQGADLTGAQLPQADLRKANFDDAVLVDARFSGSDLRWVHFRSADLRRVKFQGAPLQSALFQRADLRGARFERADINNANFKGAVLDKPTMKSLVKAYNWRKAIFDEGLESVLNTIEMEVWATRQAPNSPS
ncbi:Pentapeptide repeat-containing protein [Marinobacter zhejiangensis]|uniref:Pentapeptide repeat-containing protein n=2 Tax=Marinobacter zhejiangensis TaxID=488535 RepID=A0A1I4P153_9GAMM|nr:Pentapeptide repeat-containing protein [Marinobacter zhejiangensis]